MKGMKTIVGICLIMLMISCTGGITGKVTEETIRIGWIGPLTGDMAIIGVENQRGIQLAVDKINTAGGINDKQIEIVFENDECKEQKAITAFSKLTEAQDITTVFSVCYGTTLAITPQADANNIVLIDSLDTSEEIADAGENLFGIGIYDESIGFALAEFTATTLGLTHAGVIYSTADPFALLTKESFEQKFAEYEGTTLTENYKAEDTDFRTQLLKLKAEEVPALVIIGWEESGLVAKQARQIGLDVHLLGIDTVPSEGFRKNAGPAIEGMYFTSWESPRPERAKELESRYKERFDSEPEQMLFVAIAYDAMTALAESLEASDLSATSVKAQLQHMKNFEGITGTLTMDKDGIVRSIKEEMFQIQDGKEVKLD